MEIKNNKEKIENLKQLAYLTLGSIIITGGVVILFKFGKIMVSDCKEMGI
ncbi:MAG: hypothetical protein ABF239_01945 [Wenyingzhuangia sp.]